MERRNNSAHIPATDQNLASVLFCSDRQRLAQLRTCFESMFHVSTAATGEAIREHFTRSPRFAIAAVDMKHICLFGIDFLCKQMKRSNGPTIVMFGFGDPFSGDISRLYRFEKYHAVCGYRPETIRAALTTAHHNHSRYR